MFADLLGVRPWEWDLLTAAEALRLIDYVDQKIKEGNGGNH